ncbi:MAG: bifunctional pyr operon transcriptional regulator/uracil phosphoribosyltransferase PyrR [Chromatiales bacterium]|nr:bifunctional pyr operon transcriptional regulator/uracil phosphoribosyltransferase PyrR [Chromatiales bacterium]
MSEPKSINVEQLLDAMATQLGPLVAGDDGARQPVMVGIRTGGVWIAQALHARLALDEPLGSLNINFYRDDFTRIGMHPQVTPSDLPFALDGRHVILVDDVLYTGRTIRAALNELFDFGRPSRVTLAVLVERDGRELPIQADVVGKHIVVEDGQYLKLAGPTPLELALASSIDYRAEHPD